MDTTGRNEGEEDTDHEQLSGMEGIHLGTGRKERERTTEQRRTIRSEREQVDKHAVSWIPFAIFIFKAPLE